MNYESFVKLIEKFDEIDENKYKALIEVYGEEKVNNFFEEYLNDLSIEKTQEKFNRLKYYLEITSSTEQLDNLTELFSNVPNFDSVRIYIKEIGEIPLLTKEEEQIFLKRINSKREYLDSRNIDLESINKKFKSYGIEKGKLSDKIFELNKKIIELKKEKNIYNEEQILKMKSLLYQSKLYEEYSIEKNNFAKSNLRLVVSIAKRYLGRGMDFLDLIQEGNIGLNKAIEKFDISKGYKFSTYATWWIRQGITRGLSEKSKSIRIPAYLYELANKIKILENQLLTILGRIPSDIEIYEFLKDKYRKELNDEGFFDITDREIEMKYFFDLDKIRLARKYSQNIVSLNVTLSEDSDTTLESMIVDDTEETIENEVMNSDYKNVVGRMLNKEELPIYRLIIILRYGLKLNDFFSFEDFMSIIKNKYLKYLDNIKYNAVMKSKPKVLKTDTELKEFYMNLSNKPYSLTLEQIGDLLCITKERVRQMEVKAMMRLRKANKEQRDIITEKKEKKGFGYY